MNHRLIDALMAGIAPVVRDFCAAAIKPVADRLHALESREPVKGEAGEPGRPGKDGRDGVDGKDADPAMVERLVSEAVAKIPAPKDGEPGRDGKDGRDGIDGKDADPALVERLVSEAVAKIPAPKDGEPGPQGAKGERGEPGRDGRDASDLSILKGMIPELVAEQVSAAMACLDFASPDGGRNLHVRLAFGDVLVERAIKTNLVVDRGVWREGSYEKGDGVTCNGSFWIAQCDTSTKPETIEARDDWRLAVKRGRDGRNGKDGEPGPQGAKGDRGEPGPRGFGV